jgi:hypothetical protein
MLSRSHRLPHFAVEAGSHDGNSVIWNAESGINAIDARVWWDADIGHGVKGAS